MVKEKLEKLRNLFFETKWQSIHRDGYEYAICNTVTDYSRKGKQGSIVYMNFYRGYDILKLFLKEYEWRFNHSDLKNSNFYCKTINLGEF